MATATNGGWEVVGTKKSKPQQGKAPLSKAKKKAFMDTMPRISPSVPVKESPTIYDAFIAEEEKQERKMLEMERELLGKGGNKKQVGGPGGKKTDRKREPPTLENTVPDLEADELKKVLDKVRNSFPGNPDVWLKDLASALNLSLDKIPDTDAVFDGKPLDYPMCLLPSDVRVLLLEAISSSSAATLDAFLEFCIESILGDLTKGIAPHGTRLFVQLLLYHRPQTAIKSLEKYLAILQKNQSRPVRSLSVMWIIGQAGHSNLANGLKVWLTLMLPVLTLRNLSNYVVEYLENLFRLHSDLKSGFGVMSKADFFKLFSELYADQSNLSTDLRKRLLIVYPKIRALAWGDVATNLHNFFSPFLIRCTADCNDSKKSELLDCLVTCLTTDVLSFSVWRQAYNKQMAQSSILLNHLDAHLDKLAMNRKMLRETVRAFHLTNEELASDTQMVKKPEYHSAVASCKELLVKLNKVTFPWKSMFLLIILLFVGAFLVDTTTSGSVEKSKTYRFLEEAGALYFLRHVWSRICTYSSKIWLWLGENVPVHVSKIWEIISPYCFLVWEKLVYVAAYAMDATKTQRQWLAEKLDLYLPIVLEFLGRYSYAVLWWTVETATWLWNVFVYYVAVVTDWLLENVLTGSLRPDNIQAQVSSALSSVTPYITGAVDWMLNLIGRK